MTSSDDRREDADAWARAVAEDAAEQAAAAEQRRKQQQAADDQGAPAGETTGETTGETGKGAGADAASEFGPLVDEVRRLATTVGEKVQEVSRSLGAGGGLEQLAAPLREKHPEVYRHLAAAGGELLAAYRVAVSGHERRWSGEQPSGTERIDLD
ncbi:DUF5304 family protein [Streptomyces sp. NPDC092296]|uniref:DUF5304 family protein n=1 Tax=Streptomyces sp. NPDC092296 TaxID=3366012 RepID=UPI00382B0F7D